MKKLVKKKSTCSPSECNHCHLVWYGTFCCGGEHGHRIIPGRAILCVGCWSDLDEYLYQKFLNVYNAETRWGEGDVARPVLHEEAKKWIAGSPKKSSPAKRRFHPSVPKWMRLAIERKMVQPNGLYVYTITVCNGEPVQVEESVEF